VQKALDDRNSQYLCHSYFADQGKNGSNFCVYAPTLIKEEFERPDPEDLDCVYTAYEPDTGERIEDKTFSAYCGWNDNNSRWCPRFKGETSFAQDIKDYHRMWEQEFNCHVNSHGLYCKDLRERSFERIMRNWLIDEFETAFPQSFAQVAQNPQCIRDSVNAAYWHLRNNNAMTTSLTIVAVVSVLVVSA
jgi:hypothetical protein